MRGGDVGRGASHVRCWRSVRWERVGGGVGGRVGGEAMKGFGVVDVIVRICQRLQCGGCRFVGGAVGGRLGGGVVVGWAAGWDEWPGHVQRPHYVNGVGGCVFGCGCFRRAGLDGVGCFARMAYPTQRSLAGSRMHTYLASQQPLSGSESEVAPSSIRSNSFSNLASDPDPSSAAAWHV